MNQNRKIQSLKSEGINSEILFSLNETQISLLYNRLLESKKKEQKEVTQSTSLTFDPKNPADAGELDKRMATKNYKSAAVDSTTGKVTLNTDKGEKKGKVISDAKELDEKFESKAQQGLFWARCNKCKDKNCEWCKRAEKFSKETSKKQYKTMPEKKHPEKTVKYKKKETKEGYMDNVGKKVTDTYAKKFASFTPGLAWGGMKENYDKIIEKYTEPTMKKRELLKLIENQIRYKKSLNEDFYFGDELGEDFDMMSMPDERPDYTEVGPQKRPDYTEVGPPIRKPIRREPDEERPIRRTKPPKASYISDFGDEDFTSMSKFRNEPATKEPITKPIPTKSPEKTPDRRKPRRETPYEQPATRPQGEEDFELDMMDYKFRNEPATKEPITKPIPTKSPEKTPERRKPRRETPYEQPATRPQGEEDFDVVMEQLYNRLKRK